VFAILESACHVFVAWHHTIFCMERSHAWHQQ
jgi:hypothetical protein